jgi:alpha-glucosidase
LEKLVAYYGRDLDGTHLPFNFALLETAWHARAIERLIADYERALPAGGWPNWVLSNHDRPRIAGRVGRDQARIAAMLLLTLRGTPTIYYGDEIGMPQVPIPPAAVRDPLELRVPGLGLGRDGARTPMQWEAGDNAGFSQSRPWLPLAEDFLSENVSNQRAEGGSIYNLYRRLIQARRSSPALAVGSYHPTLATGDLLVYGRIEGPERLLVVLNLGDAPEVIDFGQAQLRGTVLVSCFGDRDGESIASEIALRPHEGLVVRLAEGVNLPRTTVAAANA